ncbi:Serine/threonine protein kinase [Nonomuraea maritima]|uniref:Serine/threonine protein kinase n=1 Tax=Nonomuraea maritima TaxID=683260 RepID=A0A1G8U985_9ACTN|nr:serine/threonine-protein kinase [Nonomuraea maritima]SDJ50319.1 Serine/threonine protein kinase [Nonomuraea maritima]
MTVLQTPAEELTEIDGYHVVGRLGSGGQGDVFLGESSGGGRVAIKVLHSCVAADSHVRNGFWCEAEIAERVAAFSTARVLDTGFAGERPYIVSEYVPGPSLDALVRDDGPRTGGGLERLAVTTLTALASIHAAGIVHRDFKPANVIMGPEGPVVIDFGIALAANTAANSVEPMGTPAYMSPEQFDDKPLTPASDMFSWAGTMVFAATGRPAFAESTVPATLNAIFHNEPDLSGVPQPLRRLLAACLAKDPAARPSAVDALCELIGSGPGVPAAYRPRRSRRPETSARRHRRTRAAGRHAGVPAHTMPSIPRPRRRHGLAALVSGVALALTAGTLLLASGLGSPADADDHKAPAAVSECSVHLPTGCGEQASAPR